MLKGFKNFLMQGDLIVIAVGLVVALAFSTLIKAFTDNVHHAADQRRRGWGRRSQRPRLDHQRAEDRPGGVHLGDRLLRHLMAVVYFVLVVPYRAYMKKRGTTVFGDPDPTKVCPSCLSDGLPLGATKCKFCASDIPASV